MNGTTGKSSQVTDVLSRLGAVGVDSDQPFIPSSTFQGAKPGYYFGTTDKGTGYYVDEHQKSYEKKRKRTVRIAEEQNETKFLPSLLEQAEKQASGSTVLELTPKGIQSASNALTKIVNQNAMQRARFPDEPRQYMNSELSLYEQLTALQAVAANAHLYQHLVDNEALMSTLAELLGHENSDICAVTVALLLEWIDPSLLLEEENSDITPAMGALAARVLREAWETVVSNLVRFQSVQSNQDDTQDQALKGIENSLSLMESLLELDLLVPDGLLGADSELSAAAYIVRGTNIVSWFFQQIDAEQVTDELKGRSMELLSLLAQKEDVFSILPDWSRLPPVSAAQFIDDESNQERKKAKVEPIQGIEILLQAIGTFRKKQPESDQEVEYLENTCGTCLTAPHLCCLYISPHYDLDLWALQFY
jgi:beta-catenin-like protein 1